MVKAQVRNGEVTITGDFFMHPEEAITDLEQVVEQHVDAAPTELQTAVQNFLDEDGVELLGASAHDVAHTVVEAR